MTQNNAANDVSLEPTISKEQLTGVALAVAEVSGYALSVKKYNVLPLANSPAWYNQFKTDLATAQSNADYWLSDLSPKMFAQVPQSIIDYRYLFNAAMTEALAICDKMGTVPTAAEREALRQLFGAVRDELNARKTNVNNIQVDLKKFYEKINQDRNSFDTAKQKAESENAAVRTKIEAIDNEIATLRAEIKAANTKQAVSGIALGVSLFVLVCAIGVAFATAGAAAPLVVGAVAIVGAAAGTVGLVHYTGEINDKLRSLSAKLNELSAEQAMAVALNNLASSLKELTESADKAVKGLGVIMSSWETLKVKLEAAVGRVDSADKAALRSLIKTYVNTANSAWTDLADYAFILQKASQKPEVVETQAIAA